MVSRIASPRGGFTLLEMILVLAILVAAAAVVLPSLHGPMQDQQLRKAGDLVRAQWAKTRLAAMKTGCIHLFRYEVGASTYSVEAWQGDVQDPAAVGDPTQPLPGAAGQARLPQADDSPLTTDGTLPSGIVFYQGDSSSDSRSAAVDGGNTNAAGTAGFVRPIVFYPDGTSTDARIVLSNERCFVDLRLRGLTGTSQGSDLLAQQELPP